jgi:hypothetical protein
MLISFLVTKGFVPNSSLEPLYQEIHSASPNIVPSGSTNDDVPSQDGTQNSSQRKSQVGTQSPTPGLLEPPPPSYDEVMSSADASPRSERSRASATSEQEYQSSREYEEDSHIYEEIPESAVSAVLFTYIRYFKPSHTLKPTAEINVTLFCFNLLRCSEILIWFPHLM